MTVDVMTRNLYLGADLMPVIGALMTPPANPLSVPTAAKATWDAVNATKPAARMAAIADEIAASAPAVVGLQEVTTWTTYDYNPATKESSNPVVAHDLLDHLLDSLADEGIVYEEVKGATAYNFASPPIPFLSLPGYPFVSKSVQLADRDVILRRADVAVHNARSGNFENTISFTLADGQRLVVDRGWGSVDVRDKGTAFRFVNAHLEAFGVPGVDEEEIRVGQVRELLAAQKRSPLPVVYVGDYNSAAPSEDAYELLVDSVGQDAWVATQPTGVDGDTCCFDALVSNPVDPLTERIDLVVVDHRVEPIETLLVGEEVADMFGTPALWPSDHAGLVATLEIAHPSAWRSDTE